MVCLCQIPPLSFDGFPVSFREGRLDSFPDAVTVDQQVHPDQGFGGRMADVGCKFCGHIGFSIDLFDVVFDDVHPLFLIIPFL